MQKLRDLSDHFKVDGYTFFVRRANFTIAIVFYVPPNSRNTYVINEFRCKSSNWYYIRSRARQIIRKFLDEYYCENND